MMPYQCTPKLPIENAIGLMLWKYGICKRWRKEARSLADWLGARYPADETFQVIGFLNCRMHRMIRGLLQLREYLHVAIQMSRALLHRFEQGRPRHVVRTRAGDENSVFCQNLH